MQRILRRPSFDQPLLTDTNSRLNSTRNPLCVYVFRLLWLLSALPTSNWVLADDSHTAERSFTLDVLPLFKQKCVACHGGDVNDIKGDYSMLARELLIQGGESGDAAVVPGQPNESPLLSAIRWEDLEMPPKENDRLTAEQISLIEAWIEADAPWPDETTQASIRQQASQEQLDDNGLSVTTSGGTSDEWTYRRYQPEDVWAFQPVQALTDNEQELLLEELGWVPDHASVTSSHDAQLTSINERKASRVIDALIHREMRSARLSPVPPASPLTLIRRATLDLHGLPPTPSEVDTFVAEFERDPVRAWESLVERLLANPRYGERWARHWLDVTRFADTGGMSNDYERSNMWRYRDYVIRAFNNDKPYDQFVVEQIAGDELADESVRQRNSSDESIVHHTQLVGDYTPQESEWIVATGFLRLGPWDNAMVEAAEARQMWLDDLVNITGQTFLSTTMRCFKCHDHKFDPLPTKDYYRMYAAFSTTHMAERSVPLLPTESRHGFESGRAQAQRMLDFAVVEKNKLIQQREAAARVWFEEHQLPYLDEPSRQSLPDEEKPPRSVGLDYVEEGQLKVREQDEWIWTRQLERYEPLAQSVYNAPAVALAWNAARKLRIDRSNKAASPPECHILIGGALTAEGESVSPGVISAISLKVSDHDEDPYLLSDASDGRRLGLARWIADRNNPLTTRSIVNRVWQHHFGVGLAANANNFGAKGDKPSHPQLLDYLANNFVENGWTLKRLHRAMMLTDAYQRASIPPADAAWKATDPNNRLLTHFPRRRLTAEEIRDGILLITGELQDRNGGVPIMPEINMEVALQPRMIQFSLAPAYQPSRSPEERNCRSIYAYHVRGQSDPFTELFNQPSPNESCEMRESAAVTPQVFTLLNSDQMTDRSLAMALHLQSEKQAVQEQIDWAFKLTFGRASTADELPRLAEYYRDMVRYHSETTADPVSYPTQITRSLVEEFSGKIFEYQEILPVFENYVPDKKAADVSPETRALADVCLLLLNTNEFIYVN